MGSPHDDDNTAEAVSLARTVYAGANDWEAALAALRTAGFGMLPSVIATREVLSVDLATAGRIVEESRTWADRRETVQRLANSLLDAMREGADEWSKHGGSWEAVFDVSPSEADSSGAGMRSYLAGTGLLVAATLTAVTVAEIADADHQASWFTTLVFLTIGATTLSRLAHASAMKRLLPVVMGAFSFGFMAQFVLAYVFFAGAIGGCDAQTSSIDNASTQLWFAELAALGIYGLIALSLWTTRGRNNTARNTRFLFIPAWIGVATFIAIILLVDYDNCGVFV